MSIASEITRLQNAKSALKTAIEGKGVSVPASAKLDAYHALVESIEAGGGGSDDDNWHLVVEGFASFLLTKQSETYWEQRFVNFVKFPVCQVYYLYRGEKYYIDSFSQGTHQLSKQGSPVMPLINRDFMVIRVTKAQDGTFSTYIEED